MFYAIANIVESGIKLIWRTVLLVFNDTFNNVLVITYNMVTSFISVLFHFSYIYLDFLCVFLA
jgi:hypothetical protein